MWKNGLTLFAEVDAGVRILEPTIDPVELRELLKREAVALGCPWQETSDGALNDAAVALIMDAATEIRIALARWRLARATPPLVERSSPDMRPCTDTNCTYQEHPWENGQVIESCQVRPIEHHEGWYAVHADRSPAESEWVVWVDATNLPDGKQTGLAVSLLTEDVERMQYRVEELNDARELPRSNVGPAENH